MGQVVCGQPLALVDNAATIMTMSSLAVSLCSHQTGAYFLGAAPLAKWEIKNNSKPYKFDLTIFDRTPPTNPSLPLPPSLLQGDLYVLRDVDDLPSRKAEVVAARRSTGSVLGWDVPSSCLRFSALRGKGRFGDVFSAVMDEQKVSVKTLRPDCSPAGKEAFDRELDVLRFVCCLFVCLLVFWVHL